MLSRLSLRCSHSPLPVLLPERVLEHLDLDRHRRCDLVQRGRVQSAHHRWQAFQERHGDGDHWHGERAGRLCCGRDLQGADGTVRFLENIPA